MGDDKKVVVSGLLAPSSFSSILRSRDRITGSCLAYSTRDTLQENAVVRRRDIGGTTGPPPNRIARRVQAAFTVFSNIFNLGPRGFMSDMPILYYYDRTTDGHFSCGCKCGSLVFQNDLLAPISTPLWEPMLNEFPKRFIPDWLVPRRQVRYCTGCRTLTLP